MRLYRVNSDQSLTRILLGTVTPDGVDLGVLPAVANPAVARLHEAGWYVILTQPVAQLHQVGPIEALPTEP